MGKMSLAISSQQPPRNVEGMRELSSGGKVEGGARHEAAN